VDWELLPDCLLTPLHLFIFDNFELQVGTLNNNLILHAVNNEDFALSCLVSTRDDLHGVSFDDVPGGDRLLFEGPCERAHNYLIDTEVAGSKFIGEHHLIINTNYMVDSKQKLSIVEIERLDGHYDKDGFYLLKDGSFYDPLGYYFNKDGLDA
jgi:hypothetical protein